MCVPMWKYAYVRHRVAQALLLRGATRSKRNFGVRVHFMYHLITEPKLPSAITRMPTLQRDVVLYASTYARSSFMYHVSLVMCHRQVTRTYWLWSADSWESVCRPSDLKTVAGTKHRLLKTEGLWISTGWSGAKPTANVPFSACLVKVAAEGAINQHLGLLDFALVGLAHEGSWRAKLKKWWLLLSTRPRRRPCSSGIGVSRPSCELSGGRESAVDAVAHTLGSMWYWQVACPASNQSCALMQVWIAIVHDQTQQLKTQT